MDQNQLPQTMPNQAASPSTGNQKKRILQKLMDHILNKQSSSVHETISALNDALSAYKNYAKEHDLAHGISPEGATSGPGTAAPKTMPLPPTPAQMPMQAPTSMPPMPTPPPGQGPTPPPGQGPMPMPPMPTPPAQPGQDQMIAGQPQQSSFNRPAPTNSLGIMGH